MTKMGFEPKKSGFRTNTYPYAQGLLIRYSNIFIRLALMVKWPKWEHQVIFNTEDNTNFKPFSTGREWMAESITASVN